MNEIRDLIIGIDFGKDYSQICYYDRKGEEPCSVSMKVGAQEFEAPTCICRRGEHKEYTIGLEAVYFAREKGGQMVDDLYGICKKEDNVQILGEQVEPWELLQVFLEGMLKFLGVADLVKNTKCLVITSPEIEDPQVKNMEKACQAIGFSKDQYMLIDHGESFYYYSLTQKRETWNRSIGWYSFHQDEVKFQQLTMDSSTRPVLVRLEEPKKTVLPSLTAPEEEGEKAVEARDEAFRDFIKETLGTGLFSSIQITGYGFSPDWAKMSIGSLCMQRRKVYYGNNLFAKGACAAGKERLEDKILKGYRYMSPALVLKDVGMEMRVMGAPAYYPLIEAGKNWYECKAGCELILDDITELISSLLYHSTSSSQTLPLEGNISPNPRSFTTTRHFFCDTYARARDSLVVLLGRSGSPGSPIITFFLCFSPKVPTTKTSSVIFYVRQKRRTSRFLWRVLIPIFTHWRSFATFCTTIFIWWILLL